MKIQPKFVFATCLVLWAPHFTANAQKPTRNSSHHISDSQILPYIIDNLDSTNSVIRVRCLTNSRKRQAKRSFIRDRLLQISSQQNVYPNYITIEVEDSCRDVKIRLPDNSYTDYEAVYGEIIGCIVKVLDGIG
jgi:hypothetical protein